MKVTWIGHACFKVESGGYSIVIDPYEDGSIPGLAPVRERANRVLCSHGHFDHNAAHNVELVDPGAPERIHVIELETFHDDQQGKLRGTTKIFVLDDGETRVVHMGDIGCALSEAEKVFLAGADVLLIPVGGTYTIGPREAAYLTLELDARYTVPMHYSSKEESFGLSNIGNVYDYAGLLSGIVILSTSTVDTDNDLPGRVIILQPANRAGTAV
ncbi:MAG: MBL fold metallo-hydrolase [Mogibacterium sp.]|nr:MBL fold metallo-hydrolase [Mogibacterium sp.]